MALDIKLGIDRESNKELTRRVPLKFSFDNFMPVPVICGILFLCGSSGAAGESTAAADSSRVAELQAQLDSLRARLDKLENQPPAQAKKDSVGELEKLLQEARQLTPGKPLEAPPSSREFKSGDRSLKDLNPNITVTGEFVFLGNDLPEAAGGIEEEGAGDWTAGEERFSMREVELGLESALDPFTRGKFFIGIGAEGVEVEEGYLQWLNLPGGLNLKLGRFYAQFGQLNRWHPHALPQADRPLALFNLLGEENFAGAGVSADFLLPSLSAKVNELTLEAFSPGGESPLFVDGGLDNLVYLAHLKNYYDLTPDTYLELGLSGAGGRNEPRGGSRSWLGGLDLTVKWAPLERNTRRGVEWRNELFWSRLENGPEIRSAFGAFSLLQAKAGVRYVLGGRVDYSELPLDPGENEWAYSANLDYWQSEWVFFRFQYRYTTRSYADSYSSFIFHLVWAMGPDKHEAY